MKKINLICLPIFMIVVLLSSCKQGTTNENSTQNFKTMVIEYQTNSKVMGVKTTEHETHWIDQKNHKEATLTQTETTVFGKIQKEETLSITDGDWSYSIDLMAKSGTKTNSKEIKEMAEVVAAGVMMNMDIKSMREFVEKNGGTIIGNEVFLGKECMVYELMGSKQWMYKGVVLKVVMGNMVAKEAIKIEEGVNIPSSTFNVPDGITMTEAPDFDSFAN